MLRMMILKVGIVGSPKILLKVPKAVAHDESGKSCLRKQFKYCL